MLASLTACSDKQAKYYSHYEPYRTVSTQTTLVTQGFSPDDTYVDVVLTSESGAEIKYKYDSDLLSYVGQGGTFYLIGTDATKCFVHIVVQDVSFGSYAEAKEKDSKYGIKETELASGRKAYWYAVPGDDNNFHIVIDAKDITPSGKGVISCYVGSKSAWDYTEEKIAFIMDKGFKAAK